MLSDVRTLNWRCSRWHTFLPCDWSAEIDLT